jgi:hypothetical protein
MHGMSQKTKPEGLSWKLWKGQLWKVAKTQSPWRASGSANQLLPKKYLQNDLGMYFMMDDWKKVQQRCLNRPLPNGTMGGVRGRLA